LIQEMKLLASCVSNNIMFRNSSHCAQMPSLVLPQVVSMKYNEDLISVWNRESENNEAKRKIEETMRKVFGLPPGTILEYKAHAAALTSSNHPNPSE
jgi:hypothetical protein